MDAKERIWTWTEVVEEMGRKMEAGTRTDAERLIAETEQFLQERATMTETCPRCGYAAR